MSETEGFAARALQAKRQRVLETPSAPPGNSSTPPDRGGCEEREAEQEAVISEYELQRLERIKRNNSFIAALSINSLEKVCAFVFAELVRSSRRKVCIIGMLFTHLNIWRKFAHDIKPSPSPRGVTSMDRRLCWLFGNRHLCTVCLCAPLHVPLHSEPTTPTCHRVIGIYVCALYSAGSLARI